VVAAAEQGKTCLDVLHVAFGKERDRLLARQYLMILG
jgi:hypothetical protein